MDVQVRIDKISEMPDFATVRIDGGWTVLQHVTNVSEIATFPDCLRVVKVRSTM